MHIVRDPGEKWSQSLGKGIRRKTKGHISNLKPKTLERCFHIIRFNRLARQHARAAPHLLFITLTWAVRNTAVTQGAQCVCYSCHALQGDKASFPLGHSGWEKPLQDQLNWSWWRQARICPKSRPRVCELTAQMVQRLRGPETGQPEFSWPMYFVILLPWKGCLGHLIKKKG